MASEAIPSAIRDYFGTIPDSSVVCLQELARGKDGWSDLYLDGWRLCSHRNADAWRGTGILFQKEQWVVMRKKATRRGTWFRLRHTTGKELWFGSSHFAPGCTQHEHALQVHDHLEGLPPTQLPVLWGSDLNAEVSWGVNEFGEADPVGTNGKAIEFSNQCSRRLLRLNAPGQDAFETPTSQPRQEGREGKRIDVVVVGRVQCEHTQIHQGSHLVLGTDHELLSVKYTIDKGKPYRSHNTRPRVWTGARDVKVISHLDQGVLKDLARKCTKPKPSYSYRDPDEVKQAFRAARRDPSAGAWTRARNFRKKARRAWEEERLKRATECNWDSVRSLRERPFQGWDAQFAEAQGESDPHEVIHRHLESIYTTGNVIPPLPAWPGEIEAFTMAELEQALAGGKRGKSVGIDGTSHELLLGVASLPGGKTQLLEFYNRIFVGANPPEDWGMAIMTLIPKEAVPVDPKSLRPICLGSATSKVYSRLLLQRTLPSLRHRAPAQCAGPERQTADYVYTVGKLMDLESCWCSGLVAAKIDLRKAFDMTHRPALLDLLWRRLGDGPVYRNWHALLSETSALLVTEWGSSFLQLDRGIRQGAVESPALFSALAEDCLLTCQARFRWARAPKAFPELLEEILFMDDGVLWARNAKGLEIKLEQWARVLLEYGLELNPAKCKVYYSPYATSTAQIKVNGVVIPRVEVLEIMGIPFRVGASSSSLIAPLITRARNKFWSLKHLFRAKTSLPGRLKLMERILGGTALWPVCAIMPDSHALGLLNATQLQLVIWMLRLAKRPTEQWLHLNRGPIEGRDRSCTGLWALVGPLAGSPGSGPMQATGPVAWTRRCRGCISALWVQGFGMVAWSEGLQG